MTQADLEEACRKLGITTEVYFMRALKWQYGPAHDTDLDHLKFNIHGIIPKYVSAYTMHNRYLESQERDETTADDLYPVILTRGD